MNMSKDKTPNISIIIPTYNGADTLQEVLAMLVVQSCLVHEILIVDSSSSDESVEVAKKYGAEITIIPLEEFDHGTTRSILSRKAKGEILVFLTQDAIPQNKYVIERLIEPLITDDLIACTYGRQMPSFNANHFAAHLRHFNYPGKSRVKALEDKEKFGLKTVFTSNSLAAYRKSLLEEVNFFKNGLIFGEDTCTVGKLLLCGYRVAYVSDAIVYHSHNYNYLQEFKRYFDIGVLHTQEKWLLDTFGKAEGQGMKFIYSEWSYLFKKKKPLLVPISILRTGLKYLGYKLGRNYRTIPRNLVPLCSMNRKWWG